MKQPIEPAPNTATFGPPLIRSAPSAIALDALVGQPQAFGRRATLPEDVDRHSAARVPVSADAQPPGLHLGHQPLADADGHVLVKAAVVAEAAEKQFQALALDDRLA